MNNNNLKLITEKDLKAYPELQDYIDYHTEFIDASPTIEGLQVVGNFVMECDFADLLHSIEVGQFQSTDELFEHVDALRSESREDKTKITLSASEKLKPKLNSDIKLINHLCEVLNMQLFNIEKGYALILDRFLALKKDHLKTDDLF